MNDKIPTRKDALDIMKRLKLRRNIIRHVKAVSKKALEIAKRIKRNGHQVNLQLVEIGALLHDIGRAKTNKIEHGIEGGKIIDELGFSRKLGRIAETHLLGGIDIKYAEILGLPVKSYLPETIEEKIVCYADKLLKGQRDVSVQERFRIWK
ncbi:MAG: HDIG domain-containing protein, partial [Promethearchaeota archaeon]